MPMRDGVLNKYLSLGGKILYNSPVKELIIQDTKAEALVLENGTKASYDYFLPACDLHYFKDVILKGKYDIAPFDSLSLVHNCYSL